YRLLAADLDEVADDVWEPIDDDVLRLVFAACHPVLSREAQVALTLKVVGGLDTEAIARLVLVPVPTMQQRIVRAKKALSAARVPFAVPEP
ncbi:sigma factor-like helix-turn-helix DNA-binding protein, partial [Acinetobacter baumannii]